MLSFNQYFRTIYNYSVENREKNAIKWFYDFGREFYISVHVKDDSPMLFHNLIFFIYFNLELSMRTEKISV